jgi:acetylornithine deacetylase/succinyl-diaminopimelate desuccinylase-like protein
MRNEALSYAQDHSAAALAGLQELLRIPSISTLPEHEPDMQRTAQWLVDKFTDIGLHHAQVMPTAGHPVVYADWLEAGPEAPTVLIYGHYDVQPVDPVEEWVTPPFEPTIKGEDLFCRGASDNKGQFYSHIMAVEAYLKSAGRLPVNVKFMLEGEEELGSSHLDEFVLGHQDLLEADAVLISDTPMIDAQTPALVIGVRGLVYMEITMRGSKRDLHSGSYGGLVQNPLNAMVRVLAALHDENGRVTIPNFYEDVRDLTPAEREALNRSPITVESVLAETGAPALWGEAGFSVAERRGVRPTLDVHGIKGGFIGRGQKTVIPAAVSAKVSMRLVPDQDPAKITRQFIDYIHYLSPKTMEVSVEKLAASDSAVVDLTAPALEAAAQAYEHSFGRRPLYLREGGTLPVVALFSKTLNTPVAMMGFGLPDDGLHAPNEKHHLPNFYRGIQTAIHYFDIVAGK